MHWAVLLGVVAGMRTMTPMAALCWFAWFGMLPETGWARWAAMLPVAIFFTLAALAEYVVDLLPRTPSRTSTPLLAARLVFGGLAGALGWHGVGEPVVGGVVMGMFGALIGTFGGYRVRMTLARWMGRDWPVGVAESLLAAAVAVLASHALHDSLIQPAEAVLRSGCVRFFA